MARDPIVVFRSTWPKSDIADIMLDRPEVDLIKAVLRSMPGNWSLNVDMDAVKAIYVQHPNVLARIGERLLDIVVGRTGGAEIVAFLLIHDVPANFDELSYNPIHEGAWAGAATTLEALFKHSDVDATGISVKKPHTGWPDNLPLLYWPSHQGRLDVAKVLMAHGGGKHLELQIKGNGERGTTVLHEALVAADMNRDRPGTSSEELIDYLLEQGAYYDIFSACARDDLNRVESLIAENTEQARLADDFGMTSMHWAARHGAVRCMETLYANGADVNAVNRNKRPPIHLAADRDQVEAIRFLAGAGCDIDFADSKGRTSLHRAAYDGKVGAVNELLEQGADPALTNNKGKTAFQIARKDAKYLRKQSVL